MPLPSLQSGMLNRRIQILSPSTSQDAYGQDVQTFILLYVCWCSIRAVTNRELYSLGGFDSQVTHAITIRFPAVTITAGMKVMYEQRTFLIQAVSDPDEGRTQLNIYSQEITS